ncbi:MAG: hypothetical protein AcusKO_29500 [Acuticoccus sp.]
MSAILDAALAYAARGWPIFPCESAQKPHPRSKAPLTEHGLKDASTDTETIRGWWARWPDALIGLPTGSELGAFVVDLDPRTSTCEELLEALETHIGAPVGDPVIAVTQSGGWHLYFAMPEGGAEIKNRAGRRSGLVANVDVRGNGGYVIAPPSVMSDGKQYAWRRRDDGTRGLNAPPPQLVDAILRQGAFAKDNEKAREQHSARVADLGEHVRKYALSALEAETRDLAGAAEGTRNDRLNETAFRLGTLVGAGALSESLVRAALEDVASAWPNLRKSRATIKSGLQAGIAQPRDLSEIERRSFGRPHTPNRPDLPTSQGLAGGDRAAASEAEITERCAGFELNDTGNAHRLLSRYRDDILHIRDVGWSVWDGKRWSLDGGAEAVSRMAQETARAIRLERRHINTPDDAQREKLMSARVKFSIASGNISRINAMTAIAATHASVMASELDVDPMAINVQNGTLRVKWVDDPECPDPDVVRQIPELELCPHNPADRISRLMTVAYDPEAKCPRWEAFVERFLPDPDVRWWMQRWHGYGLTGLTDAQLLCFNYGLGANGKSTFIEAIRRMMGDYAASLPPEAVTGEQSRRSDQATPEFARLVGVRLVAVGELPKDKPLKDDTIKLLTGGEPMLVRHLNQGFFELRPTFKAVMTGNHQPRADGSDYAIFRRLRLVLWPTRLSEEERKPMAEILGGFQEEAPGILNWLLRGLLGYLQHGLGAPDAILHATEEYRSEMDPVGEFAKQCLVEYPDGRVPARNLYEVYMLWCRTNAVYARKETTFAKDMAAKGYQKSKGRIREYLNVRLVNVPDPIPEEEALLR